MGFKFCGGECIWFGGFSLPCSYDDDDTSPSLCDPLHAQEYTYSILSKPLTRKKAASQVAGAADQVRGAEGVSTAAHKAVHEETWKGSGASRKSGQSGSASEEGDCHQKQSNEEKAVVREEGEEREGTNDKEEAEREGREEMEREREGTVTGKGEQEERTVVREGSVQEQTREGKIHFS